MFEVTIKGETLEELQGNLNRIIPMFGGVAAEPAPKATSRKKTAPQPQPEPEVEDAEIEDVEAALNEPVEPMPDTAKAIVDAGTGKPAAPAKADAPIKMTFDDVKAAAAKLAAKDTPKLAAILKKYKAAKLSDVPGQDLGEFASDVMEALG